MDVFSIYSFFVVDNVGVRNCTKIPDSHHLLQKEDKNKKRHENSKPLDDENNTIVFLNIVFDFIVTCVRSITC